MCVCVFNCLASVEYVAMWFSRFWLMCKYTFYIPMFGEQKFIRHCKQKH